MGAHASSSIAELAAEYDRKICQTNMFPNWGHQYKKSLFLANNMTLAAQVKLYRAKQFASIDPLAKEANVHGLSEWQGLIWIRCWRKLFVGKEKTNGDLSSARNRISLECYNQIFSSFQQTCLVVDDVISEILAYAGIEKTFQLQAMPLTSNITELFASCDVRGGGTRNEYAPNLLWKHSKWYGIGERPFRLIFVFRKRVIVDHYEIESANDCPHRDPRSWMLLASNAKADAINCSKSVNPRWNQIDIVQNERFPQRHMSKTYIVEGKAQNAYTHYCLWITSNEDYKHRECQIGRVQFYGYVVSE